MQRSHTSPNQIAFFEPTGWFAPIGFVVFVAVLSLAVAWWSFFASDMKPDGWVMWGLAAFFLLIGGLQLWSLLQAGCQWFGRMGVVVDRAAGAVDTYWGILIAIPWSRHDLESFERLAIGKEITEISTRSGTRYEIQYQLYLLGSRVDPLMVGRHEDYGPVRVMAEQLGQFLKMDIFDDSDGHGELLACDMLCRPAWERDRAAVAAYEPLHSAGDLKCRDDGKSLHIEFPASGDMGCALFFAIPLAGLLTWLLTYIFIDSKGEAWIPMMIFGGIGGTILLLILAAGLPSWSIVDVSSEELVIRDCGYLGVWTTNIPAVDVWEIQPVGGALKILSTQGVLVLHTSELDPIFTARIRSAILHSLSAGK